MQDRFKFRVWDYYKSKMIYFASPWVCEKPYSETSTFIQYERYPRYHKISEFMQCTGLKDKNGKLIYEGDVVVNKETDTKGHIEWCPYNGSLMYLVKGMDDYFSLDKIYNDFSETPFEVIGNIYENAELLK